MKKTLIGTAIAMVLAAPGIADAKCAPRDLTGLWDLYFTLGSTTALQCTAMAPCSPANSSFREAAC